jgi:hypothetical protein
MAYIGAPLVSTNFVLDQYTATAGQTAFTMTRTPASAQAVLVAIDGVIQEPGIAYTISGTTLTMTSGVPLDSKVWIVHLGVRGTTTSPADGSVEEASLSSTLSDLLGRKQIFTPQTLSGTSQDFTGIPSWAKKITLSIAAGSSNGTSEWLVQIGDSGGIESTGYSSAGARTTTTPGMEQITSTAGFLINSDSAANSLVCQMTIVLLDPDTNLWVAAHTGWTVNTTYVTGSGSKALTAALDRIRITTVNGTDTFDAGSWNILVEG